ncbi:MAG: bifunctional glutamate N-acetyltransferase/amino-acid acetyltransferase ArgJ [Pseudomonadota bacterium]
MTDEELRAEIARKTDRIEQLTAEVDAHRVELGDNPGISPFAPETFPDLPPVPGVQFASVNAGVRYTSGRLDVMLAVLDAGSIMAGTFTRSLTRAAPVLWCEDRISGPVAQDPKRPLAIVVNAGNANAFTGSNGMEAVNAVMRTTAEVVGTSVENVFMASTGVIGEPLPPERITTKLNELRAALSDDGVDDAASAIMTTDTFAKGASTVFELDGTSVTISGIAKGSGMIAPDMATMLVFIFSDAAISRPLLQQTVSDLTDQSFNAITVDSDTSTSDTLLVGATGKADMALIESTDDPRYPGFRNALLDVMRDLAIQVVKDGEGASKFAAITVAGAADDGAARRIGLSIANSPLVKTALAGEDPNWGRIVMAVGKSGEAADRDRLSITFGDITVAEAGWVSPDYTEEAGAAYMKNAELEIGVNVGIGSGQATVWTCDLTHGYITINADYRS